MLVDVARVRDFEIVIGFASPIGTDLDAVVEKLEDTLRIYDYTAETIRLSKLLDAEPDTPDTAGYYKLRMDKGDSLRRKYGSGDALAAVAITKMWGDRASKGRDRRHAWLLRTLKHTDEVALLRQTYGARFVLVGVYQDLPKRMRNLSHQLRDENPETNNLSSEASELVRRDEKDTQDDLGQHGQDVYAEADFYLDLGRDLAAEVERFAGLIFGEPFLTPTRDEVAMFTAFGASLRSADPGRQVGAVIASIDGDILATGANEVPKFGGGEYWPDDPGDARDFTTGHDYNKKQIRRVLSGLLSALGDGKMLSDSLDKMPVDARIDAVLASEDADVNSTRLMSLIEFGRVAHAEMSALMQAARRGVSVNGTTLYSTAFPCHMCMRLIIASGIRRGVYVDPYPKSLAFEMYGDSITDDRVSSDKVSVAPYCGASWSVYSRLFSDRKRTRTPKGEFERFERTTARMKLAGPEPLLNAENLEAQVSLALSEGSDRT